MPLRRKWGPWEHGLQDWCRPQMACTVNYLINALGWNLHSHILTSFGKPCQKRGTISGMGCSSSTWLWLVRCPHTWPYCVCRIYDRPFSMSPSPKNTVSFPSRDSSWCWKCLCPLTRATGVYSKCMLAAPSPLTNMFLFDTWLLCVSTTREQLIQDMTYLLT